MGKNLNKVAEMTIRNNTTGKELKYLADHEPKSSTLGNSYFGTLSCIGIAELQAKGHKVYNEKDWCKLIQTTFGLSDNAVGDRGPLWGTPEAREAYSVFIDGQQYSPKLAKKARETQEEEVAEAVPQVAQSMEPEVQKAPAVAAADTSAAQDDKDAKNVDLIKQAFEKGATIEQVKTALMKKYDEAKANSLIASAQGVQSAPEPAFELSFDEPVSAPVVPTHQPATNTPSQFSF